MATKPATPSTPVTQYDVDHVLAAAREAVVSAAVTPATLTPEMIAAWRYAGGDGHCAKTARLRASGPGGVGRRNRARQWICDAINARNGAKP